MTPTAPQLKPDLIAPYKKTETCNLSLHIFTPPNHKQKATSPAIIFFFGGGWVNGTPTQFYSQCHHFAERGMVAISAEYRIHSIHKTSPVESVKDGKSVIRWVREHASELHINPDKIAAGGGSAGGYVAATTALVDNINEESDNCNVSSIPQALVLFNPVLDSGPGEYKHAELKEYWQKISPFHHLHKNAPPTLIQLGTEDHVTSVKTAQKYQTKMRELGAVCNLLLYQGETHGFFNQRKFRETLAETDLFLIKHHFINPP